MNERTETMINTTIIENFLGQDTRKHKAFGLLTAMPMLLDSEIISLNEAEKQFACDWLERLALRAILVAGYLEERGVSGCGDKGDKTALDSAEKRIAKIRQVLGYLKQS